MMVDFQNGWRYQHNLTNVYSIILMVQSLIILIRKTQTAVASFGPNTPSECGLKPGGFTRLTPEVLNWVMAVIAGMEYKAAISDPGEMMIVQLN